MVWIQWRTFGELGGYRGLPRSWVIITSGYIDGHVVYRPDHDDGGGICLRMIHRNQHHHWYEI